MVSPLAIGRFDGLRLSAAPLLACLLLASPQISLANPAPWTGETLYGEKCQGGPVHGGVTHDYRNRANFQSKLAMVESTHFNERIQALKKGSTTSPMEDIDFTLHIFPNHHRALNTVIGFSLQHKRHPPTEKGLPAECYLQRAITFSPEDGVPYKLYGYYLQRKGRPQKALQAYQQAMELLPTDVMVHYNTGLVLVELKRYDKAMEVARPLYQAGLSLPGLKRKLVKAGVWEHSAEEIAAYRKLLQDKAGKDAAEADSEHAPDNTAPGDAERGDKAQGKDTLGMDSSENSAAG